MCSGCFVGYLWCFCVSVCVPVVLLGICCAFLRARVFRLFCLVFVVHLCERVCTGCSVGYLLCFCGSVCSASFVGYLLCFCAIVCVLVCMCVHLNLFQRMPIIIVGSNALSLRISLLITTDRTSSLSNRMGEGVDIAKCIIFNCTDFCLSFFHFSFIYLFICIHSFIYLFIHIFQCRLFMVATYQSRKPPKCGEKRFVYASSQYVVVQIFLLPLHYKKFIIVARTNMTSSLVTIWEIKHLLTF